jgi:hypothetical protein
MGCPACHGRAVGSQPEMLLEKMALKITSVLALGRRIQARYKDLAKVIVKFIRKGSHFQQTVRQKMGAKTQNGSPHLLV